MEFNQACEYIKSRGMWDLFLTWFINWFEDEMENEEEILESTSILYAESLQEI